MANSLAASQRAECPRCGHSDDHAVWIIIDTSERPDLEQLIRQDQLREGICAVCGASVPLTAAMLLLYRPERDPLLILAVPDGDESHVQEVGSALLGELKATLGPVWRDEWLADVVVVSWDVLTTGYQQIEPDPVARLEQLVAEIPQDADAEVRLASHWHVGSLFIDLARASFPPARSLAIEHLTIALEAATADEDSAQLHNTLAKLYIELPSDDQVEDTEKAIVHARAAVQASRPDAVTHVNALLNLGSALVGRIVGDRAVDLDEAVDALTRAAAAAEAQQNAEFEGQQVAELQGRIELVLAHALVDRVNGVHAENVDRALDVLKKTVEMMQRVGSPNVGAAFVALGNTLTERPARDRQENLQRAIEVYEQGISLDQVNPVHQAMLHLNAGNASRDLARYGGGPIDPAIDHYNIALRLCGLGMPSMMAEMQENLALALALRDAPGDGAQAMAMLLSAAEGYSKTASPRNQRRALRELGDMHFERERWAEAVRVYSEAGVIDEPLLAGADSLAGRRSEIGATGRMHNRWAYALARVQQPQDALTTVERGRTRMMRLALSDHARSEGQQRSAGNVQPRLEDFAAVIPADGVVVAIVCTVHGGVAILLPEGVTSLSHQHIVWLDELNDEALQAMLTSKLLVLGHDDDDEAFRATFGAVSSSLVLALLDYDMPGLCARLWNIVMRPIQDRIRSLGLSEGCTLILLPSGGLGLLPLHVAAPTPGSGVGILDRHPVRLAPSVFALRAAARPRHHDQSRAIIVGDPTGDLPYALLEANLVALRLSAPREDLLIEDEATATELLNRINTRRPSHLHFACHGEYGWSDPTNSRLYLAGSSPTVADVESALNRGGVASVVLSACESGVSELGSTVEEYLGWPLAFLQAGVATVISTLWPILDVSTTLLVDQFYRRYAQGVSADKALREAQLWLRGADAEALWAWLADVPSHMTHMISEDVVTELREYIEAAHGGLPFSDPVYWGSFVVTA